MEEPLLYANRLLPPTRDSSVAGGYSSLQQSCIGVNLDCFDHPYADGCLSVNMQTGEVPDMVWQANWTPSCIDLYGNIINSWSLDGSGDGVAANAGVANVTRKFSPSGLATVQADFNYMFSKLYNQQTNNRLVQAGEIGYNPFSEVLLDACRQLPGACQLAQNNMCGYNSGTPLSRSTIASSSALVSLCGCMASSISSTYSEYANQTITPQCDPLCAQQLSIRPLVGDKISPTYISSTAADSTYPSKVTSLHNYGYSPECEAAVCVMDSISVTATLSTTGGTSITQVCSACSSNPTADGCKCIVDFTPSNVGISVQDSDVSNSVVFNQYCPNALCLLANDNTGVLDVVPCSNYLTDAVNGTTGAINVPVPPIPKIFWYVIVIVIIVVLIAFLAVWYAGNHVKVLYPMHVPDLTKGVGPGGDLSSRYI